ncbi:efflux RND transporter periplasmic adaptor subunit [Shewanella marina]|uniref:efflux RND transporter periplasmic adaptor subunit n=1 Tax=Shewanella marina TaxID=487319 RepID=UPI00046F2806
MKTQLFTKQTGFNLSPLMKAMSLSVLLVMTCATTAAYAAEDKHDHASEHTEEVEHDHKLELLGQQEHGDHAHEGETISAVDDHGDEDDHGLHLTEQQRQLAGIKIAQLKQQNFNLESFAAATLLVDRDRTVTLAPQLDVRVLARHVIPGQQVNQGQAVLTLGGSEVAQAQADYINAAAEWSRVKRMNSSAVSDSRRLQAQVDVELKRAILQALKMTPAQIKALVDNPQAIGSYQLLAPISGRVQQDIAQRGQVMAAGTPLMQLTDESALWVEAQLTPVQSEQVVIGDEALIKVGEHALTGVIIGRSHELNSVTRTEQVLVSLANPGHVLHAGQFAEMYFNNAKQAGVVLPDAALSRSSDGHWQVFIEKAGEFEALEVNVVQRQRGMNLIQGLDESANVVVSGAFFLASEQAKSGFDIHNH